mmetsp:Transcript_19185/g.24892  ORF Transcript_19185/g.24892 Transcript_19185/m.24892 type:complete len:401 (+) Transcript_19185:63-1265(+)
MSSDLKDSDGDEEMKEAGIEEEEDEMVAPPVDEELLANVIEMGFPELRVRKALLNGSKNAEAALEWLLSHENDANIDEPIPLVKKNSIQESSTSAKSIRCVETGRLFRTVEEAQLYATKTGRTEFEECTEEKKPLTEEEKKQKAAELKALAARRRAERQGIEKVEEIDREKKRRVQGKEAHVVREQLETSQRQREIDRIKREKLAEKKERERLRAEIAKDKAERRARGGKLAGKLSVDGYAPSIDQNDARREDFAKASADIDVAKLNQGKVVQKSEIAPKENNLSPEEKIDKAIASISKYKTAGDGGVALKTLAAYIRNVLKDDPKFLSIPTDGRAFKERVAPLIGGIALLKAIGFSKSSDSAFLVLDSDSKAQNLSLIQNTLTKLTQAHAAYLAAGGAN